MVSLRIKLLTVVIVVFNVSFGVQSVFAQGEHTRRAATEIKVIIGDIQRLQASKTLPIHKIGLKHRIKGGLAALDILLRLADQETNKPITQYTNAVSKLTTWVSNNEYTKALPLLEQWEESYPLNLSGLSMNNGNGDGGSHELGKKLHQELCAACHDNPAVEVERPAYNLFDEANKLDYSEFLARLFLGVRGDRVTGIDNPLSDYEIFALVNFYNSEE